jgi:hypothetical protein
VKTMAPAPAPMPMMVLLFFGRILNRRGKHILYERAAAGDSWRGSGASRQASGR